MVIGTGHATEVVTTADEVGNEAESPCTKLAANEAGGNIDLARSIVDVWITGRNTVDVWEVATHGDCKRLRREEKVGGMYAEVSW